MPTLVMLFGSTFCGSSRLTIEDTHTKKNQSELPPLVYLATRKQLSHLTWYEMPIIYSYVADHLINFSISPSKK